MTLDDFRAVAVEATQHVEMTPDCAQRIVLSCRRQSRCAVPKGAWASAAACLVVMAVSAAMLISGTLEAESAAGGPTSDVQAIQLSAVQNVEPPVDKSGVPVRSALEDTPPSAATLGRYPDEQPPVQVGEYGQSGFAPAQGENGLWGYVDEAGEWVIPPLYNQAGPVDGISADVVDEGGNTLRILLGRSGQRQRLAQAA